MTRAPAMTVDELIAALQALPGTLPVMITAEGGVDYALSVRVITAARHRRDWSGTPVGQFREMTERADATDMDGEPFPAVLIDMDPQL